MVVFCESWPQLCYTIIGILASHFSRIRAYFLLSGVLGALISYDVIYLNRHHRALLALAGTSVVGAVWGALTELTQMLVPERDASFHGTCTDLLTDVLGVVTGGSGHSWSVPAGQIPSLQRLINGSY